MSQLLSENEYPVNEVSTKDLLSVFGLDKEVIGSSTETRADLSGAQDLSVIDTLLAALLFTDSKLETEEDLLINLFLQSNHYSPLKDPAYEEYKSKRKRNENLNLRVLEPIDVSFSKLPFLVREATDDYL